MARARTASRRSRPRSRSTSGARGRSGGATGRGTGVAKYALPIGVAAAAVWLFWPKPALAGQGGAGGQGGQGGQGGEGGGTVPDAPVPFPQYTESGIPRERITARQAGRIFSAPHVQSRIVGSFLPGHVLITPNVDDTRNYTATDPGWFPVEVTGRREGGWARLLLFDFPNSLEVVQRIGTTFAPPPLAPQTPPPRARAAASTGYGWRDLNGYAYPRRR